MRTYRASSLGSCTKQQIALQLGYSPLATPDKVEGWYERGRDHEVECVEVMRANGWLLLDPDPTVSPVHDEQHYITLAVAGAEITGHLDGIGHPVAEMVNKVVEIKSPQSFHKWERAHKTGDHSDPLMNRYAWQISVYMAATGLEAVVACVEDGTVKTFGIEVAPHSPDDILARVAHMETFVETGTMPRECSQNDWPCPTSFLHEKAELESDETLDTYLRAYSKHATDEKYAKEQKDLIRERLDAYLGERDTWATPTGTVTRVGSTTPMAWKATVEAAEKAGINLKPFYKTSKRAGYINVTPKEGGES